MATAKMRNILTIIYILTISITFGQTIKRQDGESVVHLIQRIKPDSMELAHQIIETDIWDTNGKAIILFYGFDDHKDLNIGYDVVQGHVFIPIGRNTYRDIKFGPITQNGGLPEILSVFFANADNDIEKELIVLCKLEQHHYDYSGQFYETYIFDNPNSKSQLTFYEKLSEKFFGCECDFREEKSRMAKYKTAKDIKVGLKKMGF